MEEVQMRIMETGADKLLAVIDHRRGGRCGGNYVIGRTDCDDAVAAMAIASSRAESMPSCAVKTFLERIIRSICCMGIPISGRKFNTPECTPPPRLQNAKRQTAALPALAAGGILERACTILRSSQQGANRP